MTMEYQPKDLQRLSNIQNNFDLYSEMLSWAQLNFEVQSLLYKANVSISSSLENQLKELGYSGKPIQDLSPTEKKELFHKDSFFSYTQTGKRIVSFALKENGLNMDAFEQIEDSITSAYNDVKKAYGENKVLEKSYRHSLDTLEVFKP